jgi:hypothetical protein
MNEFLPDALATIGLGLLATGVAWQFGPAWALMVSGLVLMAAGVAMARRDNS